SIESFKYISRKTMGVDRAALTHITRPPRPFRRAPSPSPSPTPGFQFSKTVCRQIYVAVFEFPKVQNDHGDVFLKMKPEKSSAMFVKKNGVQRKPMGDSMDRA